MPTQEHGPLSVVTAEVEAGADVVRIIGDRGSYILLDREAESIDPDDYDGELVAICATCLVDARSEIGKGLDLARVHGAAHLEGGDWVGDDDA